MHRNRYNSVQLDGLNATLLKHQKMTQLPAGPDDPPADVEAKTPMWPSERIGPGGSGAFHTPKVEYSKETADLLKRKYNLIINWWSSYIVLLSCSAHEGVANVHDNAQTN